MKIAHIVTYVSTDGAFGGPVAVAIAQTTELARRGHDVHLFAGWDGRALLEIPGVTVKLFRTRRLLPGGFSGLTSPGMIRYFRMHMSEFDVVHVHLARDLITASAARAALRADVALVLQTHGMVMPDSRPKVTAFDSLYTRTLLGRARAVLALTDVEESGLEQVSKGAARLQRVTNGISVNQGDFEAFKSISSVPEVIFLARLHPRKRVMAFAHSARKLIEGGTLATFHVIGPDEGDLPELLAFIKDTELTGSLTYEGAIAPGEATARLAQADIYVLPSYGEVVPMTVLEAMSSGTAVILTIDSGISEHLQASDSAVVVSGTIESIAAAIDSLLRDPQRAAEIASNGRRTVDTDFSIRKVVDKLESIYLSGTS